MAIQPSIIHVVSYSEADHAATAEEVIESCKMANWVIRTCLKGMPDMTADPEVQRRKQQLMAEAMVIVEAIRDLRAGKVEDPLFDPSTLTDAIKIGLLDAPQMKNNLYVPGRVRTRVQNGAIVAVDEDGKLLSERERVQRVLAWAERMGT